MSNIPENLYSIRAEANFLGSLIKNPKFLIEVEAFVTDKEMYHRVHRVIFAVLKSLVLSGQSADKVVLAQKIKEIGISTFEEINLFEYLDSISFVSLNEKATIELGKELIKLRIKRELWDSANQIQSYIKDSKDSSIEKIITDLDYIYNGQVDRYHSENKPLDLYGDIEDFINGIAANPKEETGLITPFQKFNEIFGGLQSSAGVYAVVARPKQFKSTYLQNMAEGVVRLNPGTKALILDTELTSDILKLRGSSAMCNVPYWYLNSGNWIKNAELAKKVKDNLSKLREFKNKIYHMSVPDKRIEDICSIIKRWYFSVAKRGEPAIVIYDYIKCSGESISNSNTEYMIVGNKVDALNKIAKELGIVIWTACQLNRSGEGKQAVDDGSAISLSDRLAWYAAFVGIFRKKRDEELQEDGQEFGSHKLIPIYSRFGGRDFNKNDLIKVPNTHKAGYHYRNNFLSYNVSDFRVEEKGDLNDILKKNMLQQNLQKTKVENKDTNI